MKQIKYFFQFLFIIIFFFFFKIFGYRTSSHLGGKLFEIVGPLFRSRQLIHSNILRAMPESNINNVKNITKLMWNNYGRVFAEYVFIKNFRHGELNSRIKIEGQDVLDEIKRFNKQVVFISGHFANFELMALHLDKSDIALATIYRPLNNFYLNKIMERIRNKYICEKQIKKVLGE